jgi:hypothetical protein
MPGLETNRFDIESLHIKSLKMKSLKIKLMDKKEINSPKLTANFLFWVAGVGGVLLVAFLAHFVWKVF